MKKTLLATIIAGLLISGCETGTTKNAKVIDSAVEGLEYQCAGDVRYTTKDGSVSCEHTPLGFKIGGVVIGKLDSVPADGIILPQDMVNVSRLDINNDNVKKLTILLQTLDSDNNASNGITIKKEDSDKLDMFIDLQKTSLIEFKELIEGLLGKEAKNETKALEHLHKSMKQYSIPEANSIKIEPEL